MEVRKLVCIGCPLGCNLEVSIADDQTIEVSGNTCPRGVDYAKKEVTDPRRIVTSSVRVRGGHLADVSVKTVSDVPKGSMFACVRALREVELEAPVTIGQIVLENVAGTGVDVVATKNIYRN